MAEPGTIEEAIAAATGEPFRAQSTRPVSGGCINDAFVLEGKDGRRYFVKRNSADKLAMFEAEQAGLREMLEADAIRVPAPLCCGSDDSEAWLVLEYIEFGAANAATSELLGAQLAALHRRTREFFGLDRDNTIGATPQINTPDDDWPRFFATQRLGYQLDLAERNGAPARLIDAGRHLQQELPALFEGYRPAPSLLHGDLWGGNWAADEGGRPVLFDPATYYGDREADLAMTELFGGFDERFYRAYEDAWAVDAGYQTRKTLYNLYHVLNHFNLFGGGYAGQAQRMVAGLAAEIS
ncbi:MAG: fructosamine kinase family protein [Halioglobus sp.]|nr:fructosamine kinase family protein [Halioglobus sp.]